MVVSIESKKLLIENVKSLNDIQLYQLFMLIKTNTTKYSMNNNGVFVNLKNLDDEMIQKLIDYTDKYMEANKNQKPEKVEFGIDKLTNYGEGDMDDKKKKYDIDLDESEDEESESESESDADAED
jgi:hypothetical protein